MSPNLLPAARSPRCNRLRSHDGTQPAPSPHRSHIPSRSYWSRSHAPEFPASCNRLRKRGLSQCATEGNPAAQGILQELSAYRTPRQTRPRRQQLRRFSEVSCGCLNFCNLSVTQCSLLNHTVSDCIVPYMGENRNAFRTNSAQKPEKSAFPARMRRRSHPRKLCGLNFPVYRIIGEIIRFRNHRINRQDDRIPVV